MYFVEILFLICLFFSLSFLFGSKYHFATKAYFQILLTYQFSLGLMACQCFQFEFSNIMISLSLRFISLMSCFHYFIMTSHPSLNYLLALISKFISADYLAKANQPILILIYFFLPLPLFLRVGPFVLEQLHVMETFEELSHTHTMLISFYESIEGTILLMIQYLLSMEHPLRYQIVCLYPKESRISIYQHSLPSHIRILMLQSPTMHSKVKQKWIAVNLNIRSLLNYKCQNSNSYNQKYQKNLYNKNSYLKYLYCYFELANFINDEANFKKILIIPFIQIKQLNNNHNSIILCTNFQQWNNQVYLEMMSHKPKKDTASTNILKHLKMFISLRKEVLTLCKRSVQVYKNHQLQQISQNSNKVYEKETVYKQLVQKIESMKINLVYYQRQIYNENQQNVFSNIIQTLQQINLNSKHSFYRNRKQQIQVIKDVLIMLNFLQQRFKQYMVFTQIQTFGIINQDIQQIMKYTQKLKFDYVHNKKSQKQYEIIYNFPPKILNSDLEKKNAKHEKCHSYKKDMTDATTRTPSAHNTEFGSTNLVKKLDYTAENMDFGNHNIIKKKLKRPATGHAKTYYGKEAANLMNKYRPQTARSKDNVFQNLQQCKKQFLKKNTKNQNQIKKSKSTSPKLSVSQRNTQGRDVKNSKIEAQQKKTSNITQSRQKSFQKINSVSESQNHSLPKKQRKRGQLMWGGNKLNNFLSPNNDESLQQYIKKRAWKPSNISQNLNANDYLKNHAGRKFKSHQNFNYISSPNKTQKRFKNKQKKKLYRFGSKKLVRIPQSNQNIQQIYEAAKPPVLYIKAPIQNQSEWKVRDYLMKARTSAPESQLETPRNSDNLNANKLNSDRAQISKSIDSSKMEALVSDQLCKVEIENMNKLRNQFVKARVLNPYMTPFDKQNSVFFIEQGFMCHKANAQFQKHLNELKENGSALTKQPFVIQCEFDENNNEKLKQCERYYTFKNEEQWLNTHILKQKNTKQFLQSNFKTQRYDFQL